MVSSQGVWQLWLEEVFTSAPAGSDSNRTAAVGGDEFKKFRLGTDAEHAATVKPHAMTAMTRLMITPTPLLPTLGGNTAYPTNATVQNPHAKGPATQNKRMGRPKVWR